MRSGEAKISNWIVSSWQGKHSQPRPTQSLKTAHRKVVIREGESSFLLHVPNAIGPMKFEGMIIHFFKNPKIERIPRITKLSDNEYNVEEL